MKLLLNIFLICIIFLFCINKSNSQTFELDTLAVVKIENTFRTAPDVLEFDLMLRKSSELWRYYANSTFQFVFALPEYDYRNLSIELISGTSDFTIVSPGVAPYSIRAAPLSDRVQIIILGPEKLDDAHLISPDVAFRIGKFRIKSSDGSDLPDALYWKRPILYYQAVAFKYASGDPVPGFVLEVDEEDNIDMSNISENFVSYADDASVPPSMSLDYFHAEYRGNLQVHLWFKTFSEYLAKGFILKRTYRMPQRSTDLEAIPDKAFTETIADWDKYPHEDMLKAQFTSLVGKEYGIVIDNIDYRGVEYIYRLYYQDASNEVKKLATRSLTIPNAVIEYAQADPNPFVSQTRIRYYVRDDVILTCVVFDRIGQQIAKLRDASTGALIEGLETKAGWHETVFNASDITAQGTYDVVFIAYPINDPTVELSRAIVKVQLMRDGRR